MVTLRRALLVAALFAIGGVMGVACSSDSKPETASGSSTASQASIDDLTARVQRNEMMFAVFNLSALPLHAMDESIAGGTVESTYVPNARAAVRLLALTNWDSTLKAEAETLRGHAADLLKALDDGNIDAAKDPAHELHEGYHDFADKVWAVIAKDLPADAGGVAPHTDDEGTPAAGASTPAAGATTSP
jgi:hypothetical protein